jgi:hypothetical protein
MTKQKKLLQMSLLSILFTFTFSCGEKKTETKNNENIENLNPNSETTTQTETESNVSNETESNTNSENSTPNAYTMMEVAFEGNPSTSDIQPLMEQVMKNYNLDVNEENLQKVASMLVSLRKKSLVSVTEMEILKNIYQKGSTEIPLPTQAAISLMNLEKTK